MGNSKENSFSFNLYASPNGDVLEMSPSNAAITRRLAGEMELAPGGMIVLSTDVNATAGNKLKGWAKSFIRTWLNHILRSNKIDDTMKEMLLERGIDSGWSVGNLFRGRYFSPNKGKTFNEKSFSIDIRGVPFDFVKDVAQVLRKKFDQESVLVVNHTDGKTFLLD